MAEPDWNPDTGGRSLAEILREAGIESASRAGRRKKWDDPDEAGLRQRRAEAAAAEGAAARSGYGRRRGDLPFDEPPPARDQPRSFRAEPRSPREEPRPLREEPAPFRDGMPPVERRQRPRRPPDPSTAAIPGLRPDRKPGVPAAGPMPSGPVPSAPVASGRLHSGPVPSGATAAGAAPSRARRDAPGRERREAEERWPQRSAPARSVPEDEHSSTGPIPVVRPEDLDDGLDAGPGESALAWLRFAGELLIALAAGIGIYFAATLLWENVPYLAVLLVPLAVTGLVAGVSAWRQRQGREPVGPRLLAVLVVAGTLLTIAPAAGLLAAS
jgi:hypothetical protein